jgi:CobQ-like glutamine amidotransferase family enzyme
MKQQLTIGWLYPQLMNTYGDRGNIIVLTKRSQWRDIDVEVKYLNEGFSVKDLQACNLLFMGGAQDKQQQIVSEDLKKDKVKVLSEMINDDIPGLYICGAYQFLGKYYKEADSTMIDGLGIFDLYTENPGVDVKRLIGNIEASFCHPELVSGSKTLVGFENHGGRTYLGKNIQPMAKVLNGYGNNGQDHTEGAIYKNSFGSYMHGPILPKNPWFADLLIQKALVKKYKAEVELKKIDDELEKTAHDFVLDKTMK